MLSRYCIYTIRKSEVLRALSATRGRHTLREQKRWVQGERLLHEAKAAGQRMPVVFSDAKRTTHIIAWALLDRIEVGEESTAYTFSNLTLLGRRPRKTALKKKSDGKRLTIGFIRPYAICHTPDFLPNA
jgi:hypothetical protein